MSIQRTVGRYKSRLNWDKSKWEEIAKISKDIVKKKADKKAKRVKTIQ